MGWSASNQEHAGQIKLSTVIFRFSSQPRSVILKDAENTVIYETENFSFADEHEVESLAIPYTEGLQSHLHLLVEWENPSDSYHFFTVELDSLPLSKFGFQTITSNLTEELLLQW